MNGHFKLICSLIKWTQGSWNQKGNILYATEKNEVRNVILQHKHKRTSSAMVMVAKWLAHLLYNDENQFQVDTNGKNRKAYVAWPGSLKG